MSLRSRLGMFVLTRQEQRTIAFIVVAVILGLLTQHYRHRHLEPSKTPTELQEHSPAPTRSDPAPR
jgi:hypothetical protein